MYFMLLCVILTNGIVFFMNLLILCVIYAFMYLSVFMLRINTLSPKHIVSSVKHTNEEHVGIYNNKQKQILTHTMTHIMKD